MRTFLFLCAAVSLLISAHKFSLVDASGQYKSALFFLLIGIQMLITGALIGGHQDERDLKSHTKTEKEERKAAGFNHVKESVEQGKES
ncbi:exported hypothetical protein [Candidatus Nitrospira nitrosa]|uniref:Uncharacterized protein n=1 Tax=Candidatus Nitrospira nitrosa TaxID=1742972 RepID=A0A0S4LBY8_9BACT|nr:hypothetical protein [Candidatus Nitrospira nitrosa]CUS35249.1 exported hypothetical protein [Candidatus Nitrospira nitrosa]